MKLVQIKRISNRLHANSVIVPQFNEHIVLDFVQLCSYFTDKEVFISTLRSVAKNETKIWAAFILRTALFRLNLFADVGGMKDFH